MTLITDNNDNLVCITEPKVISQDHLTISHGGKVLGTVSATFDFSGLPEDLHEMALNTIMRNRINLHLSPDVVDQIARRSWFDKIFGKKNG